MSTYNPDWWVVLKLTNTGKTIYKVLAGWSGSYTGGASWKLNSGITRVTEDEQYFYFHGSSGSIYQCDKARYGLSSLTWSILEGFKEDTKGRPEFSIEELPKETNFMGLAYE